MGKGLKNIAASVHQRLLNKAKETSRPFNELLQHFAIDRFIYRLSKSPHADRSVLKGALLFSAWCGPTSRPTLDTDLLGRLDNRIDTIMAAMKETCTMNVVADGMVFYPHSLTAARITEDAEYEGVRIRVQGSLGNAKTSLQIGIGFGDAIVPGVSRITYPVLLDFPQPELNGYSMESTIAEKFQAMVKLGELNSRMKDFYDVWLLSRTFDFTGEELTQAIEKTFKNRNTPVTLNPAVFGPSFAKDQSKNAQWQGYIRKAKLTDAPAAFERVARAIKVFIEPMAVSIAEQRMFRGTWNAPGPWR